MVCCSPLFALGCGAHVCAVVLGPRLASARRGYVGAGRRACAHGRTSAPGFRRDALGGIGALPCAGLQAVRDSADLSQDRDFCGFPTDGAALVPYGPKTRRPDLDERCGAARGSLGVAELLVRHALVVQPFPGDLRDGGALRVSGGRAEAMASRGRTRGGAVLRRKDDRPLSSGGRPPDLDRPRTASGGQRSRAFGRGQAAKPGVLHLRARWSRPFRTCRPLDFRTAVGALRILSLRPPAAVARRIRGGRGAGRQGTG